MLHKAFSEKQSRNPNPQNKSKYYDFSQNDDDEITLEIIKIIGIKKRLICGVWS